MAFSFDEYIAEINGEVSAFLKKTGDSGPAGLSLPEHPVAALENRIRGGLAAIAGGENQDAVCLASPASGIQADYTVQTFQFAKKLRRAPPAISADFAQCIRDMRLPEIADASAVGGYVNIAVKRDVLYGQYLRYFAACGAEYGRSRVNSGKRVLLDFSSPNIAKPLGIGHLRSTIIGHALANIYGWTCYSVIRDNHLGDWGTQFGELLYAYKTWGDDKVIAADPIRELKNLYVRFHNEAKADPALDDAARKLFGELESGSPELLALWKKFRDLSISGFNVTYRRIGVDFDFYMGESFFVNKDRAVIEDCLAKKLCRDEGDGSRMLVVDCFDGVPSFLLRKQDGSGLYITRDLAAIKYRAETFRPDALLYVVGSEQSLHFKQLFTLAAALGYLPENVKAEHIAFGMVLSGNKKMSTRAGTVVELDDVLAKAVEKAREILESGGREKIDPASAERIIEQVGVGAVLYHDLRQERTSNISFDWDKIIRLEAGSSAYLQYTHVRIKSIIRKASGLPGAGAAADYRFENPKEFALARKVSDFPQVILSAQRMNAPHLICTYLEELAQLFNSFYSDVQVLASPGPELLASRVRLLEAVAATLENGLKILGIQMPPRM